MFFLSNITHWATHKNNFVSGRPAGWLYFTALPGPIFFFFFSFGKLIIFESILVRFSNGLHHYDRNYSAIIVRLFFFFGKKKEFPAARVTLYILTRSTGNRLYF